MLTRTFGDLAPFKKRRQRLFKHQEASVIVLFSGEEGHLSTFRPASNFVYLTGFEEPDAAAVIVTGKNPSFHLFVRDRDPSVEVWDGERFGPERAGKEFGADACYSIDSLADELPKLMSGTSKIYFALGDVVSQDELILECRDRAQQLERRSGQPKVSLHDPLELLAPMRMVKDDYEISLLREACELSARAHIRVMESIKPGMNERQSQGEFVAGIYSEKASQEAYCSIVASGANACTLHYRANVCDMRDGDFLLIDAGGEKNFFKADITRTYPVSGHFSDPQRKLYSAVLDVQKNLIEMVKVGFSLPELHEKSCELLTEKMIDLGLLSGDVKSNIESKAYHKYYPHGVGHYLGMDVHDVGFSKIHGKPVPFKAGTVITVEPGIYVPESDTKAPEEFRGLGVRIEDDVLVTAGTPEVLTRLAPKEVADLEKIIGSKA